MSVNSYRLTGWLQLLGVDLRAGFSVPRSVAPGDRARVRRELAVTYLGWVLRILESAPEYVDDPAEVAGYRLAAIHDVRTAVERVSAVHPSLDPEDALTVTMRAVRQDPLNHRAAASRILDLRRPLDGPSPGLGTVRVFAPVPSTTETVGNVQFVHGVGETSDEGMLAYFERHGYDLARQGAVA